MELEGRTALVTGGTSDIGAATVRGLARRGADVIIHYHRSADKAQALADEVSALGRKATLVQGDLSTAQEVKRVAQEASAAAPIDILVNNAGNAGSHKFLNHSDELWHRMLSVNLTSVYYVSKAFVPTLMNQRAGRIINVASIASRVGGQYIAAYTAAKHGVLGLTRALAVELLPNNITVNAICPGYVNTPMTDASINNIMARTGMTEAQAREALEKTSPQHRLIEADEIAAIAVFLAQESSKGITGQAINIDGGGVMS